MQCTRCGSHHYRKNGSSRGVQRYVCKTCGCSFSARPRKFSYADIQRALDMYLNNVGIRKVTRFMVASPALIVRWIKAFGTQVSHQLQQAAQSVEDTVPDVIEMDAIDPFVQKNGNEPA